MENKDIKQLGRQFVGPNDSMTEMLRAASINRPRPSDHELEQMRQLFGEDAVKNVFGDK